METPLSEFVKARRKFFSLTQVDLAYKAGVGLRFVRDLEQGKPSLQLDKVNLVLRLFNHEVGPVPMKPYEEPPKPIFPIEEENGPTVTRKM